MRNKIITNWGQPATREWICGPLLCLAIGLSASLNTGAGEPTRRYAIAAQSLNNALMEFATQSRVKLIFDADVVRGQSSSGLTGAHTLEQGLARLLEGTGLRHRFVDAGTVTLDRVDPLAALVAEAMKPRHYAGAAEPAPKEPEASPPKKNDAGPTVLPEMTVTASPLDETSYNVQDATTATKTDTPIFDTPVSVQVVPYQVLQDQKAYRLRDALENVSGVRPQGTLGYRERYIIPGFRAGENFYRNGLRVGSSAFSSFFETASTEQIKVLKGGSSILYGRGQPSGAIAFVTKQPTGVPYYSIEQDFGSYDYYRTNWDLGGPLTAAGSLAYRVSGAYTNTGSFRDFASLDGFVLYPTLLWRPTANTDVNLGVEVVYEDFHTDYGVPALGRRPADIPISRSFSDPNDPEDNQYSVNLDYSLTHGFNESWSITNRFLASYRHENNLDVAPLGHSGSLIPGVEGTTLNRFIYDQDFDLTSYTTNLDLKGKFQTGAVKHEVLLGFDYFDDTADYFADAQFVAIPDLAIDIFNPRYGVDPVRFTHHPGAVHPSSITEEEWYGVYFQDHLTLWDRLHVLGGGRKDWINTRAVQLFNGGRTTETEEAAFSPRVGLLYQPWSWLGVYGNWSQSFGANNGLTATGESLPPETGEQYEAGLKREWLDGRLNGTLAFYHITKENISTPDFTTPDPFDRALIGEARSRGIEFDLTGRIVEGLDLIATYAFTDARITKDGSGNQGHRVAGVPEHSSRLWLKYALPPTSLFSGWSLGGGPYIASSAAGDNDNSFVLPGFVRLDAFVGYRFKAGKSPLTFQLNVRNLLDKTYFEASDQFSNAGPRESILPGDPLTVIGSIRVEF